MFSHDAVGQRISGNSGNSGDSGFSDFFGNSGGVGQADDVVPEEGWGKQNTNWNFWDVNNWGG